MGYISKYAGPKLREALEAAKEGGPDAMLCLEEELAMAKVSSHQAVRLYEAAWFPKEDGKEASLDLKAQAAAGLRSALEFVSEIATRSARVRAMHDGTKDAQTIKYVLDQVAVIFAEEARREFGTESPKCESMVAAVAKRLEDVNLLPDTKRSRAAVVVVA